MVQILVQLDEATARELEKVAPAASRQRSRFIRMAIQSALMQLQESKTREAYRRLPDDEPAHFDPSVWSEWRPRKSGRGRKSRR
jgi:hypothetical protein